MLACLSSWLPSTVDLVRQRLPPALVVFGGGLSPSGDWGGLAQRSLGPTALLGPGAPPALFGLGGSGMVTARALSLGGAQVTAFDDNPQSVLKAETVGIKTRDLREVEFGQFDQLILAPGVPLTHPHPHWVVKLAKQAGVAIIGDIDLFCHERRRVAPDSTLIAITGKMGTHFGSSL